MELNVELGKLYDTLRFFEIYFNYDEVVQDLKIRNFDIKEGLKYYKRVKNNNIEISPELHAFFDFNKNEKSLLTGILINNIKRITTIRDYLLLLKNKELILNNIIDFYFGKIDEQIIENLKNKSFKEVFNLEINGNVKTSIVLILNNFEVFIDLLINSIYDLYTEISKLHKIYNKLISEFIIKDNYLSKLKELIKLDAFDTIIYCISLLQSYSFKSIDNYILILGNLYEKVLDKEYTFLNVTINSICNTFANPLNTLIIDIICESKKITAADILKLLPPEYSSSNVYRIIGNLHKEKVIYIIENVNNKIYYSLNSDYFENAGIVFNQYLLYYVDRFNR